MRASSSGVYAPGRMSQTLRAALDLAPEHLSCYALIVEDGTRLALALREGRMPPVPGEDDERAMYDAEHQNFLVFLKNIDAIVRAEDTAAELRRETIRITDQVVDKQMRTVQEIASLLGETTAETKVALTMLKKSML